MKHFHLPFAFLSLSLAIVAAPVARGAGFKPLVPGTGIKIEQVGDDFEDPKWSWEHYWPKSSEENNKWQNAPGGESGNGRWFEGIKRGHPDHVKRVATPPNGLPGSKGSLLLRTLYTGVPGHPSYTQQQDDFICNVMDLLGGAIPVHQNPSFVTRIFLPPVKKWEKRSGCHFAVRAAVDTQIYKASSGNRYPEQELYYPGMFIEFETKEDTGYAQDTAYLRVRADNSGYDYKAKDITVTGWWTLGMSFTPDGAVHYYAKPGVSDLTKEDYITSHFPYGYRCQRFRTFFFDLCNGDDGRTWSSELIVDDSTAYFIKTR